MDKLTKYTLFIPTTTTITKKGTAKLFFHHLITQYGIPRQAISYRDTQWKGKFWKEICSQMGIGRALTTAYHPQANRQTEIMNQTLDISLRAYIGPDQDDWTSSLDGLALSYNSTPHTATGFTPAYLLRGYVPTTELSLIHWLESIPCPTNQTSENGTNLSDNETLRPKASEMVEQFTAERHPAQEVLLLGQDFQRRAYNRGRLSYEFEEGDMVLINPHSLSLLKSEKG